MKKIFTVALLGATLLYAESSAFGAGDITSNSSYGLTSNEKLFKEKLDNLNNENIQTNARINEINERIEGLQSTLESINSQYAKSNSRLSQVEENNQNIENNFTSEIQKLKAYVEESRKIQEANNKQVKKVLAELSFLVDAINANYVSKNELNDANLSVKTITPSVVVSTTDSNSTIENNNTQNTQDDKAKQIDESWKKKKNNEILELAIKDVDKNAFEDSKAKLNFLITKQYKPARANFWLGEIE
ncbi:hypothetical protein MJJ89_001369, partial [Campylobacter jejuni]|nr:hypothetical protein [Campylobacter jejuni]